MKPDFTVFWALLNEAIDRIYWLYFETPVAGQVEEIARERLFCYELYHQLRNVCDDAGFEYWLGGELDKSGHPLIRGDLKPDLVVHEPGYMDKNLCVIEVKPILGSPDGFAKDIRTLTQFVLHNRYHAGVLLVFGDADDGDALIRKNIQVDPGALLERNIFVLWVQNAQSKVKQIL